MAVFLEGGKTHWTTYADILRVLEPLNEGRDERDRITYDSLWIHTKRHYAIAGMAAYWSARMHKELRNARRPRGPDSFPFTGRKDSAEGTLSIHDALRAFSIRTVCATDTSAPNKALVTSIVSGNMSAFLSTDFIL